MGAGALGLGTALWTPATQALPPRTLVFPADHGAHPDQRTEWWYITGHARSLAAEPREFGFQLTFFRTRVDAAQSLQSKFAAKQLIFAHAAMTDVQGQKLWHDQRIAREGFGLALAATGDTALQLGHWRLQRQADSGLYKAELPGQDFG
ncbi:MAG: carotenoid 1,2-hydratase, partial [Polaromonas sp.]|nr:carotenoid 1,2-hydratase [Polaromonas sp.]